MVLNKKKIERKENGSKNNMKSIFFEDKKLLGKDKKCFLFLTNSMKKDIKNLVKEEGYEVKETLIVKNFLLEYNENDKKNKCIFYNFYDKKRNNKVDLNDFENVYEVALSSKRELLKGNGHFSKLKIFVPISKDYSDFAIEKIEHILAITFSDTKYDFTLILE